jgi:Ring finger domain
MVRRKGKTKNKNAIARKQHKIICELRTANRMNSHLHRVENTACCACTMIQIVDPSCLIWAILRLYVTTLICLIPLSICLLYSLLRLIKCNDASEASILCALAGCAFYGIVISSLWKEDMEVIQQRQKEQSIRLKVYTLSKSVSGETEIGDESRELRDMSSPCPICLDDYEEGNEISFGERCNHVFHAGCINRWTDLRHTACPCCRQHLLSRENIAISSIVEEVRLSLVFS